MLLFGTIWCFTAVWAQSGDAPEPVEYHYEYEQVPGRFMANDASFANGGMNMIIIIYDFCVG